ncbi:MAG: class I SAM-dependent methyltransferase [Planctomycetota bacterium]|jgi:SAM-dependent methyltransferase
MDRYSLETKAWLDLRFDPQVVAAVGHAYHPYQPIDGVPVGGWATEQLLMSNRWARLLTCLRELGAESFLDVGGAEGMTAELVRQTVTRDVWTIDLSTSATERAIETFGLPALASEAHRLPFADDSIDVVYCGEVIEHLANPVETLLELGRVARLAVIVSTEEGVLTEEERREELDERRLDSHMDRTILCPGDFALAFPGWSLSVSQQFTALPESLPDTAGGLVELLERLGASGDGDRPEHAIGLFVVAAQGVEAPSGRSDHGACEDAVGFATDPRARNRPGDPPTGHALLCPLCGSALPDDLSCTACAFDGRVRGDARELVHRDLEDGSHDLAAWARRAGVEGEVDLERLSALADLLDLPDQPTHRDPSLPLRSDAGWWGSETCALEELPAGGFELRSTGEDPAIQLPNLWIPLESFTRVLVRFELVESEAEVETAQVFFRTLHRPLFWEAASTTVEVRRGAGEVELAFALPERGLFGEGDVLTQLRFDPTHHGSLARVHSIVLD